MKLANATMDAENIFLYMTITGLLLVPVALWMTDFSHSDQLWLAGPRPRRHHPDPERRGGSDAGLRLPLRPGAGCGAAGQRRRADDHRDRLDDRAAASCQTRSPSSRSCWPSWPPRCWRSSRKRSSSSNPYECDVGSGPAPQVRRARGHLLCVFRSSAGARGRDAARQAHGQPCVDRSHLEPSEPGRWLHRHACPRTSASVVLVDCQQRLVCRASESCWVAITSAPMHGSASRAPPHCKKPVSWWREYVAAGFRKIHLDCSMSCADDPRTLGDEVIAERAAHLVPDH